MSSSSSLLSPSLLGAPCECGLATSLLKSWTRSNPGSRFWACANYNSVTKRRGYGFFKWYDVQIIGWQRDVCNELLNDKKELKEVVIQLENEMVAINSKKCKLLAEYEKVNASKFKKMNKIMKVVKKCAVVVLVIFLIFLLGIFVLA